MARIRLLMLVAAVVMGITAGNAVAGEITYTEEVFASGTFGGIPFTDEEMHITLIGDTANVKTIGPDYFYNDPGPGTVLLTIEGFPGVFIFLDDVHAYDQATATAGFAVFFVGTVLATDDSAFSSYDLKTSIGPITGSSEIEPFKSFATTGGPLKITSAGDSTFTATAKMTTVAEPTTLSLLGIGLVAMCRRKGPLLRSFLSPSHRVLWRSS